MGLFRKSDDITVKALVNYISGLDEMFREDELVDIIWSDTDKKVTFQSRIADRNKIKHTAHLTVDKIKMARLISEKEIIEKQKSIGGRAIAGGLLLGPLGAIVGGMSGIGNKAKSKRVNYVVFNYNDSDVITFEVNLISNDHLKVLELINTHLNNKNEINL